MESRMPDSVWPEWKFVKQIGRGSYGIVYEAVRCDEFGVESSAAIKVISIPQNEAELDSLSSEGFDYNESRTYMRKVVDAFVNEVKLMTTFKGVPNIVSVDDYKVVERENEIGWDIYIRMELLTPLSKYAADKELTENDVVKIGCDICSALEICAKKGVIHRDIKPANIFINEFGNFKLGDFGIARQMESMTTELSRKGTGSYMAPEVEKGEHYDARADIYSLGLVLYYLLNKNRLPFLDLNKQLLTPYDRQIAIRRRLDGEQIPAPFNASPVMANVILTACAYDQNRRFATASAMKNALLAVPNGQNQAPNDIHTFTPEQPEREKVVKTEDNVNPDNKVKAERKPFSKKIVLWIVVCAAAVVVVFFGVRQYRLHRQGEAVESSGASSGSSIVDTSHSLESYYDQAKELHDQITDTGEPDYRGCISYIESEILKNNDVDLTDDLMADIYYLYADSFYQRGDYDSAVDAYRSMYQIGTDEPVYYRDYAIALADSGNITRAEDILSEAEEIGLAEDSIYYARGMLEKSEGEYDDALEDLYNCTRTTEDEEMLARSYLARAEIYGEQGDVNKERESLLNAKKYDSTVLLQILLDLADVDIDRIGSMDDLSSSIETYRQEAIEALELIIDNGWGTFDEYDTLYSLYTDAADTESANNLLQSMEETFPEDYRVFKKMASLELERQDETEEAYQDYSDFAFYYNKAMDLYDAYLERGEKEDDDMLDLKLRYQSLQAKGKIDSTLSGTDDSAARTSEKTSAEEESYLDSDMSQSSNDDWQNLYADYISGNISSGDEAESYYYLIGINSDSIPEVAIVNLSGEDGELTTTCLYIHNGEVEEHSFSGDVTIRPRREYISEDYYYTNYNGATGMISRKYSLDDDGELTMTLDINYDPIVEGDTSTTAAYTTYANGEKVSNNKLMALISDAFGDPSTEYGSITFDTMMGMVYATLTLGDNTMLTIGEMEQNNYQLSSDAASAESRLRSGDLSKIIGWE